MMLQKKNILAFAFFLTISAFGIIPKPKEMKITSEKKDVKEISQQFTTISTMPFQCREDYSIRKEKGKSPIIDSKTAAGRFYAEITLKQLEQKYGHLPEEFFIKDGPDFAWRGLMLDVSRHFFTVDEIKRLIKEMAKLKLNKLHLHLNDNEAWRIEIKEFPQLTYNEKEKFFTQEQMHDLVKFAQENFVEIIPEIDLPGHAHALLKVMPQMGCYDFVKENKNIPNAICIGSKQNIEIIEKITKELNKIFPSEYLHLGGDEVDTKIWQNCEKCKKLTQGFFTQKMQKIAEVNNKKMLGWDEINDKEKAPQNAIIQIWRERGFLMAEKALGNGHKIVMSPQYGCYFDWGYGGNSTRFVYEWNPISTKMKPFQSNVLGVQACLWTEKIEDEKTVQKRLFPRLAALAEVAWSNSLPRDLNNFSARLENCKKDWQKRGIEFTEDSLENAIFNPEKDEKTLMRNANISTNIPQFYAKEFAYDGRENSFFWSAAPAKNNDFFLLELGEPIKLQKIKILTGDSKDFLQHGILEISEDGKVFKKVADFINGIAENANINQEVRAVRLKATANHDTWLIIREIILN